VTYLVQHHCFFWDNVWLVSVPAHWYYDNGFTLLTLPEAMDFGHPPLLATYIAGVWRFVGKSLAVAHWAMLPFLLGIVWEVHLLTYKASPTKQDWKRVVAVCFVLLDPVLLTQMTLVAQDTMMIWAYLFCANRLLAGRRGWLALGLIMLCFCSMRGMICAAALGICDGILFFMQFSQTLQAPQLLQIPQTSQNEPLGQAHKGGRAARRSVFLMLSRVFPPYIPAAILVLVWLVEHYVRTGWIGTPPTGAYWKPVDALGILRNAVIALWRLVDMGRGVSLAVACGAVAAFMLRRRIALFATAALAFRATTMLCVLTCVPLLVLLPFLLATNNPVGHRYLLPVVVPLQMLCAFAVCTIRRTPLRRLLVGVCLAALVTGHLWVLLYPHSVSKGWDATLAHVPYYGLRGQMMAYMQEKKIPAHLVGTAFPNTGLQRWIDANDAAPSAAWQLDERDTERHRYILTSAVFNGDLKTSAYNDWRMVQEYAACGIYMRLLERPRAVERPAAPQSAPYINRQSAHPTLQTTCFPTR
jgi:hypothetical protein